MDGDRGGVAVSRMESVLIVGDLRRDDARVLTDAVLAQRRLELGYLSELPVLKVLDERLGADVGDGGGKDWIGVPGPDLDEGAWTDHVDLAR